MVITIQILNGPRIGHRVFLKPEQRVNVGRTEYSDWAFPNDGMLSSVHFRLNVPGADSCEIFDLASTNGTYVNGKKVTYSRVTDGDVITAGTTVFRVCCQ